MLQMEFSCLFEQWMMTVFRLLQVYSVINCAVATTMLWNYSKLLPSLRVLMLLSSSVCMKTLKISMSGHACSIRKDVILIFFLPLCNPTRVCSLTAVSWSALLCWRVSSDEQPAPYYAETRI